MIFLKKCLFFGLVFCKQQILEILENNPKNENELKNE